ncbi:MAG TPA: nucleotidyltransferase domain-containing protein [Epsilonproteobacteria bacterium]|nr:nucleotidyltransferase domain-containing protein [Campylobacterota bacterium]
MKDIEDLKAFLKESFPDARIYLFGSRARDDASRFSDIDIAIEGEAPLKERLAEVRFAIEESLMPWKVDIVDLKQVPYLKDVVRKEGILWH